MSIQIGKLLPDGSVRHIKVLHETLSKDLSRKLRVFYPNDKRVDALLSLGDIHVLGPSPYGKWVGYGDAVHCYSRIRDGREQPGQFSARLADNADIFSRMEDICLLFDNGKWHVVAGNERMELSPSIGDVPSHDSMAPITVYVNNQARLEKIDTPRHWQELQVLAEQESRILYVYRKCRLVKIVRSSNLKRNCMRHNNIVSAIEWLPEHLFTEEIVEAAVESKEIEVLSFIPGRFLTAERIEHIIAGSKESWHSFELRNIPVRSRSQAVCDFAMRKNTKNIAAVPEAMVTREMAESVIKSGRGNFDILACIPERLWDTQLAYLALRNYIYEPYYTTKADSIMITELILGYVPAAVKTRDFYYGMLDEVKILSTNTDAVVPSRFKTKAYYCKMAEHDLSLVPAEFYSYEILYAAVCSADSKNFITDPKFYKPLSVYLDDMLADRLIEKCPYMFRDLPKPFRTSKRLLIAIKNSKRETNCYIDEDTEKHLLTTEVCKAFVRRNGNCPEFPRKMWTRKFVDYCMEHGTDFRWYRQMPREFQTSKNTQAAYDCSHHHICDFAKRFITPQMAKECYREDHYERVIPRHFFTEFCRRTGLPEKFYGGETSMLSLKNEHNDYTYCKIGNTYLAFYLKERYEPSSAHLMMTRSDSKYCTPEPVFDVPVGTFHRTWLEKIVAENDPRFVKPRVDKSLKAVQAICYYGVEKLKDLNRTEIFRNTFMGETIGYCARRRDLTYHSDSCETLIEGLKYKIRGMAVPMTLAEDMTLYTADRLHEKYGFCYTGMTAFATDYGLDMDKAYSPAQMRQIVQEKGHRPSLRNYQRELKRINVI